MKRVFQHPCTACGKHDFSFHEAMHKCITYQWVCACGVQMGLRFFDGGQSVEQTPTGKRCERTLALIRVRSTPSLMFIYEGCAWGDPEKRERDYFYHEHACPTNLLRCEEIIDSGDADPHGLFELVAEYFVTGPKSRPRDDVLQELTERAQQMTLTAKMAVQNEG